MEVVGSQSGSSSSESPETEQHIVNFRNATFIFPFMHTDIIKLYSYLLVNILNRSQRVKTEIAHCAYLEGNSSFLSPGGLMFNFFTLSFC